MSDLQQALQQSQANVESVTAAYNQALGEIVVAKSEINKLKHVNSTLQVRLISRTTFFSYCQSAGTERESA